MDRWLKITRTLGACLVAVGCGAAWAQNGSLSQNDTAAASAAPTVTPQSGGAQVSHEATQAFVNQAAYANQSEIAEARYVLQHTHSSQVRQFARRMISDHTMLDRQLRRVAEQNGYSVPSGVDSKDRAMMTTLEHDRGSKLNAVYSMDQTKDHRQVIAQFEQAADDPRIAPAARQAAEMALPILRMHLQMANQLVASEAHGNRSAG